MKKMYQSHHLYMIFVSLVLLMCAGCAAKYTSTSPKYATYDGEINHHFRLTTADKEKIFDVITNEAAFQKISPWLTTVTHEAPLPYQVGTIVKTHVHHRFKFTWHSRVEEIVPGQKIRLTFLDGFFAGGTEIWEFEEQGDQVRVSHTITVNPKGFLRKLAWLIKVRKRHDNLVEETLDKLKVLVEQH